MKSGTGDGHHGFGWPGNIFFTSYVKTLSVCFTVYCSPFVTIVRFPIVVNLAKDEHSTVCGLGEVRQLASQLADEYLADVLGRDILPIPVIHKIYQAI